MYPGQLELMNLFVLSVKKLKTTYIIFFLFVPIFDVNLDVKASNSCPTDGSQISAFIKNLDQDSKVLLLLGCFPLPFDSMTVTVITSFVASAISKTLRTERLIT